MLYSWKISSLKQMMDGGGQTSCVGCDCIAHGENKDEESEVIEVSPNAELIVKVTPVADVIPTVLTMSIYLYNQHMRKRLCIHSLCWV